MSERLLVPSIEKRLGALIEVTRRGVGGEAKPRQRTVTISREFGCEAFPLAERLKTLLEEKTGEVWALADRALLDEVAADCRISRDVLESLGHRPGFIDELLSTLSPAWKTEKDYYRLLCEHIISLAARGNFIIVGMGASIITQSLKNCAGFRLTASPAFKIRSIARRMNVPPHEAEAIIDRRQGERDRFVRAFLNTDPRDLRYYDVIFNNDRSPTEETARAIAAYLFA